MCVILAGRINTDPPKENTHTFGKACVILEIVKALAIIVSNRFIFSFV